MESILTSIKKLLGIQEDYEHFDTDLIMHINTVFMILNQLGVGPDECYSITSKDNTWDEFLVSSNLEAVKSYIYLKTRLLFDPPQGSAVMEAVKNQIAELESRLLYSVDPKEQ